MGWRWWTPGLTLTNLKKEVVLGEKYFLVIGKHVEDVKQKRKDVPDLVESIMRPTDPAKEGLRRISFNMRQFRPEIIKIRVSTFWMSGQSTESRRRPTQLSHSKY